MADFLGLVTKCACRQRGVKMISLWPPGTLFDIYTLSTPETVLQYLPYLK